MFFSKKNIALYLRRRDLESLGKATIMQSCALLSVLFLRREEKEPKEASTSTKLDLQSTSVTTRESSSKTCLSSRCSISSPYMGRLNRSSCRSYIKVRSDHQRSGVIFSRLRTVSSRTLCGFPFDRLRDRRRALGTRSKTRKHSARGGL